jgi:hypothetical protein
VVDDSGARISTSACKPRSLWNGVDGHALHAGPGVDASEHVHPRSSRAASPRGTLTTVTRCHDGILMVNLNGASGRLGYLLASRGSQL